MRPMRESSAPCLFRAKKKRSHSGPAGGDICANPGADDNYLVIFFTANSPIKSVMTNSAAKM